MKLRVMVLLVVVWAVFLVFPGSGLAEPFELWVTQSPPGNADPATWGGIIRYRLEQTGAAATGIAGIDRSEVSDPAGLVFRETSGELLIGNRHGNTGGGSISRFFYDNAADSFTANGTIAGNGLYGVHQLALNPVTGELFATNYGGGISRFVFDGAGNAIANGTIGGSQWTRGVAVSPDGKRLYATSATPVIRQFDLETGMELGSVSVTGSVMLHYIRLRNNNELYVADPFTSKVYQLAINGDNELNNQVDIDAPSAVSVAFSPDGQEMFATGHLTSHQITRLRLDPDTQLWQPNGTIYPNAALGDIWVMPLTGCRYLLTGDCNNDCRVNMIDFSAMANAWLSSSPDARWNESCNISTPPDNTINLKDLAVMAASWLVDCNETPNNPVCVPDYSNP